MLCVTNDVNWLRNTLTKHWHHWRLHTSPISYNCRSAESPITTRSLDMNNTTVQKQQFYCLDHCFKYVSNIFVELYRMTGQRTTHKRSYDFEIGVNSSYGCNKRNKQSILPLWPSSSYQWWKILQAYGSNSILISNMLPYCITVIIVDYNNGSNSQLIQQRDSKVIGYTQKQ